MKEHWPLFLKDFHLSWVFLFWMGQVARGLVVTFFFFFSPLLIVLYKYSVAS